METVVVAVLAGALASGAIGWFVGKDPTTSRGGDRGFVLGFALGPIGVVVAAILRVSDQIARINQPTPAPQAATPSTSSSDLVARGMAPLPRASAPQRQSQVPSEPGSTGMISISAQDLRSSDELLRDGRFVKIETVNILEDEVRATLRTGEEVVLQPGETVRIHR